MSEGGCGTGDKGAAGRKMSPGFLEECADRRRGTPLQCGDPDGEGGKWWTLARSLTPCIGWENDRCVNDRHINAVSKIAEVAQRFMGCGGRCGCRRLAWVASAAIANILGTLQREILPIRRSSFIPVLTVPVMVRLSCCAYISRVWSVEHGRGRRDTRGGLVSKVADADEPAKCEWSWCVDDHHGSASLGIT